MYASATFMPGLAASTRKSDKQQRMWSSVVAQVEPRFFSWSISFICYMDSQSFVLMDSAINSRIITKVILKNL
jgi:hypothetical protein